VDEEALERALSKRGEFPPIFTRPLPDWSLINKELKRKGVTLQLLWREYLESEPAGYRYSQFAEHYRRWLARIEPVMRQVHRAGERVFVDYAGLTMEVVDVATGEIRTAQIFVAALGASNYTYAEATWTQQLPDWIASHVRAVEYFGGAPELFVPDNTKSGVTKPCYYEPLLNQSYAEFAAHYQSALVPTRVRRPRDKAKVETAVVLAIDRPALKPLPAIACYRAIAAVGFVGIRGENRKSGKRGSVCNCTRRFRAVISTHDNHHRRKHIACSTNHRTASPAQAAGHGRSARGAAPHCGHLVTRLRGPVLAPPRTGKSEPRESQADQASAACPFMLSGLAALLGPPERVTE
jgi:transposase